MRLRHVVLLVLAGMAVTACGSPESDSATRAQPEASLAPDFEVTTFAGERFGLHEQAGTPVVLNFWESW